MKVRFRHRAAQDIDDIHQWKLSTHSRRADEIRAQLIATCDWLGDHPELGTETDEPDVRRWPIHDPAYTIFYLLNFKADTLDILRVKDARQVRNIRELP